MMIFIAIIYLEIFMLIVYGFKSTNLFVSTDTVVVWSLSLIQSCFFSLQGSECQLP